MTNPSSEIQDERDFQRNLDELYQMADEFFDKADSMTIVREARFSACRRLGHKWIPVNDKNTHQICGGCGTERWLSHEGRATRYIYPKGYKNGEKE